MSPKEDGRKLIDSVIGEILPTKEAEIESVGGFTGAMAALLDNERMMGFLARSFNPEQKQNSFQTIFATKDQRHEMQVSVDPFKRNIVRLVKRAGTQEEVGYYQLEALSKLGTITHPGRAEVLKGVSDEEGTGTPRVFIKMNESFSAIAGLGDNAARTLEEVILQTPAMLQEFNAEIVGHGLRTMCASLPTLGNK